MEFLYHIFSSCPAQFIDGRENYRKDTGAVGHFKGRDQLLKSVCVTKPPLVVIRTQSGVLFLRNHNAPHYNRGLPFAPTRTIGFFSSPFSGWNFLSLLVIRPKKLIIFLL